MEYSTLLLAHKISVILFLLIYLVKTTLLMMDKKGTLLSMTKVTKVPEMIISTLFLVTGVWMFIELGSIKTFQIIKLVAVLLAIPIAIVGFKRSNKFMALLSIILIIAAYGLAEMSKKKVDKAEIQEGVITDKNDPRYDMIAHGEGIYNANCVTCHGEDGKKMLNNATDLSLSILDEEQKKLVILNGRNSMAPYKNVLSEEEIDAVVIYIETLKQ